MELKRVNGTKNFGPTLASIWNEYQNPEATVTVRIADGGVRMMRITDTSALDGDVVCADGFVAQYVELIAKEVNKPGVYWLVDEDVMFRDLAKSAVGEIHDARVVKVYDHDTHVVLDTGDEGFVSGRLTTEMVRVRVTDTDPMREGSVSVTLTRILGQ